MEKSPPLYNYDNLEDAIEIYLRLAELTGDDEEKSRWQFVRWNICEPAHDNEVQLLLEIQDKTFALYKAFLSGDFSDENCREMMHLCYIQQDYVMYFLMDVLRRKLYGGNTLAREWVRRSTNMGHLGIKLNSGSSNTFIVIAENNEDMLARNTVAEILSMLGQKVYFLDAPLLVEVDEPIALKDTLEISIDNMEEKEKYTVIHPVKKCTYAACHIGNLPKSILSRYF